MRTVLALLLLICISVAASAKGRSSSRSSSSRSSSSGGHVAVKGHTTKKGTYVPPHHRSAPNKTDRDNWSTKGNVNPDTGKEGTKTPKK